MAGVGRGRIGEPAIEQARGRRLPIRLRHRTGLHFHTLNQFAAVPSLDRMEWEHIQRLLTECGGYISRAARLLGLHRRTLQWKFDKLTPAP